MHFENMLPFRVKPSINLNEPNLQLKKKKKKAQRHSSASKNKYGKINHQEEGKTGQLMFSEQT